MTWRFETLVLCLVAFTHINFGDNVRWYFTETHVKSFKKRIRIKDLVYCNPLLCGFT